MALPIPTIGSCCVFTTYPSYFSSRAVRLLYTEAEELAGLLWPKAGDQQLKVLLLASYQWHTSRTDPAASPAWCPQHQHRTENTPSKFTGAWWDGTAAQRNVDGLDRNLTKFNYRCCKVPHLGQKSPRHPYVLETGQLESSSADKDLGVLVGNKLSMSGWCTLAAQVGNSLLHCIKKIIINRSREALPPICLALVLSFRLPSLKLTLMCCKAIHATKLKHKLHQERLRELGLLSLEKTRL